MPGVMDITVLIAQIQLWKIHHVRFAVVSIHYGSLSIEFSDSNFPAGGRVGAQVTYDPTSKLWACCTYNEGKQNCSEPTDEVFPAPDPSSLEIIIHLPATGPAIYPAPSATTKSVSNTNTSSISISSNVSPGSAAGIGIGVGAGIILAAAAIAFVLFKRRRLSKTNKLDTGESGPTQQPRVGELGYEPIIRELEDGHRLYELNNTPHRT
ncbi:hypothetical protein N7491_011284 [Penicillium cf. griseofulvum]|uniref:Uncharacterized protein n=1 Tax=Penicillium cf. griseofulvum TaxID=2972120 RepID=A0A9W9MEI7_9EURO|nr:hypothetical protein N7472_004714 [Penicillium cf. griseofulvum]KAJ5416382.1 hypothetical protein N7491_011284 [Penicillium cf. griseofulvum]KAJ5442282.1 hypothetical protein N7445_005289 [Penicillium cf. griseofulvum]